MDELKKINELIETIPVAMLVTRGSQGELHSRPMATQKMDKEGCLWFFMGISSLKSIEVSQEKHVNLIYSKADLYISVVGTAEITQDKIQIHALWDPRYKVWFPLGLEDEELALLKVRISYAEYWKTPHSVSTKIMGFAKNVMTGDERSNSEHGVLHA
jgi:general stress protein 26